MTSQAAIFVVRNLIADWSVVTSDRHARPAMFVLTATRSPMSGSCRKTYPDVFTGTCENKDVRVYLYRRDIDERIVVILVNASRCY